MKKYQGILGLGLTALSLSMAAGQAPFTAGNLAVLQVGDGAAPLAIGGTPLFLLEITPTGTIVQTIPVPTTTSGANHALVVRGTSTSVAHMNRSVNGQYLTFCGIDAPLGGATSVSATPAATNPRIIARVNSAGVIDTSTALGDAYNADDIRCAVSVDGSAFWTTGTSATASTAGCRYSTFGATTSTQISSGPPTNTRFVGIANNQLYITSASGTFLGVSTIGTGLPTTSGELTFYLNGFPTIGGTAAASPYDFYFADANTLYVCDDRGLAAVPTPGGVQKWVFNTGTSTWELAYTLNSGLAFGPRGVVGKNTRAGVTLWVTGGESNAVTLATVTDTGASSAFTVLATSPVNTAFRGIDFVPEGGGPAPCYPNCDASTSIPLLTANDFQCFLNAYASGLTYANCDGSTSNPLLTANDFQCFLNAYATGCR